MRPNLPKAVSRVLISSLLTVLSVAVVSAATSVERLDPTHRTGGSGGEDPLSQNFNWSLPLVSLPGRAGMDLGLMLSYNSLVWTTSGGTISFDDDKGFPSPGFRLGFPVIQALHFNSLTGKYGYLLIGPDGSRTELRQVDSSVLFAAADSSHLLLDTSNMILRGTDGTQLTYVWTGNQYNCTQIKDRNGNYISVTYSSGRISTVTDTLGRVINFNYDANGLLTSITQVWNQGSPNQVTHSWATFTYIDTTIQTNFSGLTVYGPANSSTIKTLSKVTLPGDSHIEFTYTSWGQVRAITALAGSQPLNYRSYNLPQTTQNPYSDCPRFTQRREWARYWNGDTDGIAATNEEALTTFTPPVAATWTMPDGSSQSGMRAEVTAPDGTLSKIYFIGTAGTSSGWRRGLPALEETHSGGQWQRKVMTTWTQDNVSVAYQLNPRVTETNVYDPAGNRARTETTYQQFTFADGTSCHLPRDVYEYALNATTKLRSTRTDYNVNSSYTSRRILGLVSEKQIYQGDINSGGVLLSRTGFFYDNENGASSIHGNDAPVQHDNTNFTASFVTGRANLSSVRRYDVTNGALTTTTSSKYNTAGAVVSAKDALNHESTISYADSFSDGNNSRNTLAYPTTFIDADLFTSVTRYHFDFGAVTYTRTPKPNETTNIAGPERFFTFDSIGRILQITNSVNSAYTRYEYTNSQSRVDTVTTMQEGLGESRSFRITDGAGRVIATATDHPGSVGGYSAQRLVYDVMGRTIKTSNPAETTASGAPPQWTTAGEDAAAGWVYTEQTYDWKGRPLVSTNQDGTTKTASYAGCGCAGGEIVTLTDEGSIHSGMAKRRQRKIYSDVLGRVVKTEILNWEAGSVYSATVNTYNALDQLTQIRQYAGAEGSTTFQDTTMTYDGFGRLKTRHIPEQNASTATTWDYNADDTTQKITDARGATTTFAYNNRRLITSLTYAAPSPIPATPATSFTYDGAGNRKSMTDASGTNTFQYSQLSQLTSETKTFTGLANSYTLSYEYSLAGNLKSLTDHTNKTVNYGYDRAGRMNTITGTNYSVTQMVNSIQYRAWNAPRQVVFANGRTLSFSYNQRLSPTHLAIPSILDKDYEYYNDRRLKYAGDNIDGRYDRSYNYDHSARIIKSLSGAEARGEGTTTNRPYHQFGGFDAFDHVTSRTTRHWSKTFPYIQTNSYSNNRRTGWQYDADGNLINDNQRTFTFDAAGRMTATSGGNVGQVFDGNGRRIKTIEPNLVTYYLTSSVLGAVIAQLDDSGTKQLGFIYAFGELIGEEFVNGLVGFVHKDASGLTVRKTISTSGVLYEAIELDPQGSDAELEDPYLDEPEYDGREEGGPLFPGFGNITSPGNCTVDGIWMPCDMAYRMLGSGAAVMAPPEGTIRYNETKGTFEFFRAYADGYSGFLPAGARYKGNGRAYSGDPMNESTKIVQIGKTPQHILDENILKDALENCIKELYPMFEMTSYKATGNPTSGSNDDKFNGVVEIKAENGSSFKVVSDPTPPQYAIDVMKSVNARGVTYRFGAPTGDNPFWTYNCPTCDRSSGDTYGRPAETRYPELYRNLSSYGRVQIHELGAALTLIRNAHFPALPPRLPYPDRLSDNGLYPNGHGDDGPAMEDCIGRKYFNLKGLKPRS